MRNEKEEVQYIWHDGATIREDLLITMAKNARGYEEAKGYVMSLMAHGLTYGIRTYIYKVNSILEHHGVAAFPIPDNLCEELEEGFKAKTPKSTSDDDVARKMYLMMTTEKRKQILMLSLATLLENHSELFRSKNDWMGIYLVIHDRLNGNLSRSNFTVIVKDVKPIWWPEYLKISQHTMTNFSRCVDFNDRAEAYYDMENNPWKELCDTYWVVLKQLIMTNK